MRALRGLVVIEFATTRNCMWRFMEMTDGKKKGVGWACVGAGEYPRLVERRDRAIPPEEVRRLRFLKKFHHYRFPSSSFPPSPRGKATVTSIFFEPFPEETVNPTAASFVHFRTVY